MCKHTSCIFQTFFPQCFVFVVVPIFSVHLYFTLLGKEAYFPLIYKLFLSCWVPSQIKDVSVGSMVSCRHFIHFLIKPVDSSIMTWRKLVCWWCSKDYTTNALPAPLQQQPLLCGLSVQFLIACLQFLRVACFLLTLPLCFDMYCGLPTMIKDPNVCGKADSICSSTTVGKCNMGIATSYPYNLSGILLLPLY
jgi:hypothetical protein